jgi:hypothetical protein
MPHTKFSRRSRASSTAGRIEEKETTGYVSASSSEAKAVLVRQRRSSPACVSRDFEEVKAEALKLKTEMPDGSSKIDLVGGTEDEDEMVEQVMYEQYNEMRTVERSCSGRQHAACGVNHSSAEEQDQPHNKSKRRSGSRVSQRRSKSIEEKKEDGEDIERGQGKYLLAKPTEKKKAATPKNKAARPVFKRAKPAVSKDRHVGSGKMTTSKISAGSTATTSKILHAATVSASDGVSTTRLNHASQSKTRPCSAAATCAGRCVAPAIGVKDVVRTGYHVPEPFVIKKSTKPLTSVQPFTLKTAARCDARCDDAKDTENANSNRRLACTDKPLTPKRCVKESAQSSGKGSEKRRMEAYARTANMRNKSVIAARLRAAFPHDIAVVRSSNLT